MLVLSGCAANAEFIASNGSHFVIDNVKTDSIHEALYQCALNVAGEPSGTAQHLKKLLQNCDDSYYDSIEIRREPPTFYTTDDYSKSDMYEDFYLCIHGLSSPMYDIPDDYPASRFRYNIISCVNKFPR